MHKENLKLLQKTVPSNHDRFSKEFLPARWKVNSFAKWLVLCVFLVAATYTVEAFETGSTLAKLHAPTTTSELKAGERKAAEKLRPDAANSFFALFTHQKKPYYITNIYEKFDGALAYSNINKTTNPANDVYGLPYIHGAKHLISKNKEAYNDLQFDTSVKLSGLDFQGGVLTFSGPNLEQMRQEYESLLDQLETNLITWQQEQLTNSNDWTTGRKHHIIR